MLSIFTLLSCLFKFFKFSDKSKSSLKAETFRGKLGSQDFHYDMEVVLEPFTEKQKQKRREMGLKLPLNATEQQKLHCENSANDN